MKQPLLFIVFATLMFGCKPKAKGDSSPSNTYTPSSYSSETENTQLYPDGEYCAEIDYHNSNTGTNSTYTLTVEVENNELTVIHWPNGGWLDASHFTPPELESDGTCSFTSDKSYDYDVRIIGKGGCVTSSRYVHAEPEEPFADEDEGEVIWAQSGCNYVIIEISGWYVVADKSYGAYSLERGDRVRGDLTSYGFEDFYNISDSDEQRVYVDNYYGSKSSALEKVYDKCDLNTGEEEY